MNEEVITATGVYFEDKDINIFCSFFTQEISTGYLPLLLIINIKLSESIYCIFLIKVCLKIIGI